MTHDLLRYARESAIALREAHAEIHRLRAELARLRKAIEEARITFDTIYEHPLTTITVMRIAEEARDMLRDALDGKS